jgi:hypothetical protein
MKNKSQLSREMKVRIAIGALGLLSLVVVYFVPTLGTAVDLALLTVMTGLLFEFVWEGNKKLEERENRGNGSCSWRTTRAFFSHLEADLHLVDPNDDCKLQIYRGYDQGKNEQNWDLQREIIEAIQDKRIDKFRKVNVVTTPLSIPFVIDWIQTFAEDEDLRDKSTFYVSFRKNQNVGSYVILGSDNCYIAFAGDEIDNSINKPSKTVCGMFTQSAAIHKVIDNFIKELRIDYRRKEGSIHGMLLDLDKYVEDGQLKRTRLEADISARFKIFDDRMSTSPEREAAEREAAEEGEGAGSVL